MIFVQPLIHINILEEGIFKKFYNKFFAGDKIKIEDRTFLGKKGITLFVDIPRGNCSDTDMEVLEICMTSNRWWFEDKFKESLKNAKINLKKITIEYIHFVINKSTKNIYSRISFIDEDGTKKEHRCIADVSDVYKNLKKVNTSN